MKYYAVSGRIPFDDEDQTLLVGQCRNWEDAVAAFKREIHDSTDDDYLDVLLREHGQTVIVNSIVSSETPITIEAP